jgi:hypothetical protein
MKTFDDWDGHDWPGAEDFDTGEPPMIGYTLDGMMSIVASANVIGIYPHDGMSEFWMRTDLGYAEARGLSVAVECTHGRPEELTALGFDFYT